MSNQPSSSSSRSSARRLLNELNTWRAEQSEEKGIERLGPPGEEDDLFAWEAVVNGKGIGGGYDAGRWLLAITIPPTYPLHPPKIRFVTSIIHPNVAVDTGEICLDLLKEAWTPTYSILQSVRAVRMLLGYPEIDSPLNVDAAVLLREGDALGMRRLVEFWCEDDKGRYRGP